MDEFSTNNLLSLDITDDTSELTKKIIDLENKNEDLTKQIRQLEHKSEQKLNEIQIENDKLLKIIKSQESLINSLHEASSPIKVNTENLELEKAISELQSKNLLIEQNLFDLKRQYQNQNIENSNLKFEIEKMQINSTSSKSYEHSAVINIEGSQSAWFKYKILPPNSPTLLGVKKPVATPAMMPFKACTMLIFSSGLIICFHL